MIHPVTNLSSYYYKYHILSCFIITCISAGCLSNHYRETDNIQNRKLQWSDFKGEVDWESKYDAMVFWDIYYNYDPPLFKGDTAILNVTVKISISDSSWVKPYKKNKQLLKHEQGHVDIAKLAAAEFRHACKNSIFIRDNYRYKVDSIFQTVLDKYKSMGERYDIETNHMLDAVTQREWDTFFKEKLRTLSTSEKR